jgi:hypothetical protein
MINTFQNIVISGVVLFVSILLILVIALFFKAVV